MQIFIPRLTNGTSKGDLFRLTRDTLSSRLNIPFTKKPKIHSCDILRITDRYGVTEYHGLVTVTPDSIAEWYMRKLRGQKLHGKLLVAREYFARVSEDVSIAEQDDRRRNDIKVSKLNAERVVVEGLDQFRSEHH